MGGLIEEFAEVVGGELGIHVVMWLTEEVAEVVAEGEEDVTRGSGTGDGMVLRVHGCWVWGAVEECECEGYSTVTSGEGMRVFMYTCNDGDFYLQRTDWRNCRSLGNIRGANLVI